MQPMPSEGKPKWEETYFPICDVLALRSDDPNRKLGCVIAGLDHEIVSVGYNGLPRGVFPDEKNMSRPDKYHYMEHAEKNAILNATRYGATLKNCKLYCHWPPCSACARSIIQAGITEVCFTQYKLKQRWQDSMEISMQMLAAAGVMVYVYDRHTSQRHGIHQVDLEFVPDEEVI